MPVSERWTITLCRRCGRTGLHAGDCLEGAVYPHQGDQIEVVRAEQPVGAVDGDERVGPACDCGSTAVINERRHAIFCRRRLWIERNAARTERDYLRDHRQ